MNEMKMVRDLLAEPPPASGQARAQALHQLETQLYGRSARRRIRPPLRWTLGLGTGLAGAAAGLALLLSAGTSPTGTPETTKPLSVRNVLLAAAEQAEKAPTSGTYWHTKSFGAFSMKVGPKGDQYWMDELRVSESWTKRGGENWFGYREVGARPHSPADAAAWKRDGSPAKWDRGRGDTADRKHIFLHLTPQPGRLVRSQPPVQTFQVCDKELNFQQVQDLPADPAALTAHLKDLMRNNDDGPVPADAQEGFVTGCLTSLLVDIPARPQTRAAAYRALATRPSVKVVGPARDDRGRSGIAITISGAAGDPVFRYIIDLKTSVILAREIVVLGHLARKVARPGQTLLLEVGWTDEKPHPPTW